MLRTIKTIEYIILKTIKTTIDDYTFQPEGNVSFELAVAHSKSCLSKRVREFLNSIFTEDEISQLRKDLMAKETRLVARGHSEDYQYPKLLIELRRYLSFDEMNEFKELVVEFMEYALHIAEPSIYPELREALLWRLNGNEGEYPTIYRKAEQELLAARVKE